MGSNNHFDNKTIGLHMLDMRSHAQSQVPSSEDYGKKRPSVQSKHH